MIKGLKKITVGLEGKAFPKRCFNGDAAIRVQRLHSSGPVCEDHGFAYLEGPDLTHSYLPLIPHLLHLNRHRARFARDIGSSCECAHQAGTVSRLDAFGCNACGENTIACLGLLRAHVLEYSKRPLLAVLDSKREIKESLQLLWSVQDHFFKTGLIIAVDFRRHLLEDRAH